MVDPMSNHETYEPKPAQMIALSKSAVYFTIGLPFEDSWLKRFSSSNINIVSTDKNIAKLDIKSHNHDEDSNKHNHSIKDPHIWLDPLLIKEQVLVMVLTLCELFPENKNVYMKNLKSFDNELEKLTEDISNKLGKLDNRDFLVFHPSWGYFANRFNLNQIVIETEGKEPKASELVNLLKLVKEKNIKALFSEPEIPVKSANLIAKEIGAEVYVFDPLKKDVSENLLDFTNTLLKSKQ